MKKIALALLLVACGKSEADRAAEERPRIDLLARRAKDYFIERETFAAGAVGPSPAVACCASDDHRCHPTDADWSDPIWQKLRFRIDGPHVFQYRYESDGATFTATAVGDPNCDGHPQTWTAHGSIGADRNPTFSISAP